MWGLYSIGNCVRTQGNGMGEAAKKWQDCRASLYWDELIRP